MKFASVVFGLLFVATSFAGVIQYENGTKVVSTVTVPDSALLTADDGVHRLDVIGAGLRTKKVLVANVNVYVAQIFLDNPVKFVRTSEGALASLDNMKAGSIRLTFLRDVEAEKVQVSFRDAFDANDIDVKDPGLDAFLKAVAESGDAENKKSMSISLVRLANGQVRVSYEDTKGAERTVVGNANLFKSIFAIWLGESADNGLAVLKNQLLKGLN